MSRLLSANFARLFRSVWFWACGLLMLGYSLWQAADMLSWAYSMWSEWSGDFITSRAGDFAVPVVIVLPVLSAMFLGAEYHYNTVRNKIIAGYSRWQVYLANLITVTAAGLIYAGVHVLVLVASGFFIRRHVWDMGALTMRLLYCLPFILAVSALSTLLAMLIRLRALPVLAILLSVALLWLPQRLHTELSSSPELVVTDGVEMVVTVDDKGEAREQIYLKDGREITWDDLDRVPNPQYVGEPLRGAYYFIIGALPGGQAFYLSESLPMEEGVGFPGMAACSMTLAAMCTALGLRAFRRKDLR